MVYSSDYLILGSECHEWDQFTVTDFFAVIQKREMKTKRQRKENKKVKRSKNKNEKNKDKQERQNILEKRAIY